MQFYSRINYYPLKFPKAAKVKVSKCFSKEFWKILGLAALKTSRCEEKNVPLLHMLNHVNMIDTNPPFSFPMQSANSGKGSIFGYKLMPSLWPMTLTQYFLTCNCRDAWVKSWDRDGPQSDQ